MKLYRPKYLLAGFHASQIEPDLPELIHIGEQWANKEDNFIFRPREHWLFLQINGESRWQVNEQFYEVKPGNCLVMPPAITYQMLKLPPLKHHFFFVALEMEKLFQRLPNLKSLWEHVPVLVVGNAESLMLPFRQLIREVSLELPHRSLGLRVALDYLMLEISRLLDKQITEATPPDASLILTHPAVLRVRQLLDNQPGFHWQLAELARLSGLSPQHLVKCFTRDMGVSPHQYLMQIRIKRAKEWLGHSDLSVTALALELGFASSQHFATVYKRLTGEPPHRYRSLIRAIAP